MRSRALAYVTLLAALVVWALSGCSGADGGDRPADARGTAKPLWQPRPGLAWQWQLDGKVDPSAADVPVYDIDGFENSAADVARLHRDGRKVICYLNVGAWEDFRPDRDAFPRSVLGRPNGWAGERWLDIRRISVLRPIMERRFDMCRDKGFDAVEPDLVEGYGNETGFPLTARDQLRYNRMVADLAHERGLSVGLKNDLPQIPQLLGDFDFAVNEECAQYDECGQLTPFILGTLSARRRLRSAGAFGGGFRIPWAERGRECRRPAPRLTQRPNIVPATDRSRVGSVRGVGDTRWTATAA